jgi:hypothetical protein
MRARRSYQQVFRNSAEWLGHAANRHSLRQFDGANRDQKFSVGIGSLIYPEGPHVATWSGLRSQPPDDFPHRRLHSRHIALDLMNHIDRLTCR